MSAADNSLDMLDPAPHLVQFRGEPLEIRPLTIGKLPAFSRLVRPVIAEFAPGRNPGWESNDDLMIVELYELHGEEIIEAAALATGLPMEWIEGAQDTGDLLELVRAIIHANRDFFTRAVMAEARARAVAAVPEPSAEMAGSTPSSTSSGPDTR